MPTYTVVMRADVMQEVTVEADNEDQARDYAYAEIGDDYEVDFYPESIYEVEP